MRPKPDYEWLMEEWKIEEAERIQARKETQMQLCSGGRKYRHEEVCSEGDCPACEALEERDGVQTSLEEAQKEIAKLERELDAAKEG